MKRTILAFIISFLFFTPFVRGETMKALLVGQLYSIVTDPIKTQEFLDFVRKYQFTELTFYTGGPLETRVVPGKELDFSLLLTKLPAYGVTAVNIAIGSGAEMDRVMRFIDTYRPRITGFHLEYEWWNNKPRDFENAATLLKYMRQKGGPDRRIGAYIGWTTQSDMDGLVPLVDRLFIHAYVPDGKKTYAKIKGRLDQIMVSRKGGKTAPVVVSKKTVVYPLFSAEWLPPEICNQGPTHPEFYEQMCFMGPWLKANGGPTGAEAAFNRSELAGRTTADNWRNYAVVEGFFFYEYNHLKKALQ